MFLQSKLIFEFVDPIPDINLEICISHLSQVTWLNRLPIHNNIIAFEAYL